MKWIVSIKTEDANQPEVPSDVQAEEEEPMLRHISRILSGILRATHTHNDYQSQKESAKFRRKKHAQKGYSCENLLRLQCNLVVSNLTRNAYKIERQICVCGYEVLHRMMIEEYEQLPMKTAPGKKGTYITDKIQNYQQK